MTINVIKLGFPRSFSIIATYCIIGSDASVFFILVSIATCHSCWRNTYLFNAPGHRRNFRTITRFIGL